MGRAESEAESRRRRASAERDSTQHTHASRPPAPGPRSRAFARVAGAEPDPSRIVASRRQIRRQRLLLSREKGLLCPQAQIARAPRRSPAPRQRARGRSRHCRAVERAARIAPPPARARAKLPGSTKCLLGGGLGSTAACAPRCVAAGGARRAARARAGRAYAGPRAHSWCRARGAGVRRGFRVGRAAATAASDGAHGAAFFAAGGRPRSRQTTIGAAPGWLVLRAPKYRTSP